MLKPAPSTKLLRALSRSLGEPAISSTRCRLLCRHLQTSHRPTIPSQISKSRNLTSQNPRQTISSNAASSPKPRDEIPSSSSSPLPDISTYYTIFPQTLPAGPPPSGPFTIPLPALRREFLSLQAQHHPDKYTSATTKTRAEALSALINEAYRTLRDPLLRAQYLLLHTYKIDVTSEDNSAHGEGDPQTLALVMDVQEGIEGAADEAVIRGLKSGNEERIGESIGRLEGFFGEGDAERARKECVRLKYWASLREGLDAWEGKGSQVRLVH